MEADSEREKKRKDLGDIIDIMGRIFSTFPEIHIKNLTHIKNLNLAQNVIISRQDILKGN